MRIKSRNGERGHPCEIPNYWSCLSERKPASCTTNCLFLRSLFATGHAVPVHILQATAGAHRSGSRLGAASAASETTSASMTSSPRRAMGGMVRTPNTALHMALCTATAKAPHQRCAQPCAAEWRSTARAVRAQRRTRRGRNRSHESCYKTCREFRSGQAQRPNHEDQCCQMPWTSPVPTTRACNL